MKRTLSVLIYIALVLATCLSGWLFALALFAGENAWVEFTWLAVIFVCTLHWYRRNVLAWRDVDE